MYSAAQSLLIFELREREYYKSHKEEEGTNFIQLLNTYCFIPGYFNITCGSFASKRIVRIIHTLYFISCQPKLIVFIHLSFQLYLLVSSSTVVKKVRKRGVFSVSYNFLLAKFLVGFSYLFIALITLDSNEN